MCASASVAATLALEAVEAFMAILSSLFAFSTSFCTPATVYMRCTPCSTFTPNIPDGDVFPLRPSYHPDTQ